MSSTYSKNNDGCGGGGTTTRDGIVTGTAGNDFMDTSYVDKDGDRPDSYDAILPGAAPNDDLIYAKDGNDTVIAGLGDDKVYAGSGNDYVDGGTGNDTIYGECGNDTLWGREGQDLVFGGEGADLLKGGAGNDTVEGGTGNDVIYGGDLGPVADDGADVLYGGEGDDTVNGGISIDPVLGAGSVGLRAAGAGGDVIFGGNGADKITGSECDDTIYGGEGADLIKGLGGNDLIFGEQGSDELYGGTGNDSLDGAEGADWMYGEAGDDLFFGGQGADRMYGGAGNDTMTGGVGADRMEGGDDRDLFYAGAADRVDGGSGGDDYDVLDLTDAVPPGGYVTFENVTNDPDGNSISGIAIIRNSSGGEVGRVTFSEIERCIPCFTPGSLIATPRGEVPVESLKVGDKVITRDNGIQEIRWVGQKDLSWANLVAMPHLKPVLIRQGSLGNGLPERDMLVSPNHRMLVSSDRTQLYFDEHEVLVSAKHLVSGNAIRQVDRAGVSYIHFLFDEHQIVLADGAWTESFQPGDYSLKGIGNAQRSEILELFPELATEGGLQDYVAARRTLKRHEARLLVR